MRSLEPVWNLALARPYAVVFVLLFAFYFVYLAGVELRASVFADGAGRWLQIQGLIAQNFSTFACHYDTAFDPEFRWLPGPWYFYYMVDGVCFYFYQYPYAMLAAPFVYWSPDYGYFVLNFIFLTLYIFATMRTAREIFARPAAELATGLIAFLVIPSPTFAYDLSEVMLFLAMLAAGLWFVVRGSGSGQYFEEAGARISGSVSTGTDFREPPAASSGAAPKGTPSAPRALLGGGLIIALAFALRTEAAIFLAAVAGALSLVHLAYGPKRSYDSFATRMRAAIAAPLPFILGAAAGLLLVVAFHYAVFGNIAGNRGTAHVDQVLAEFSVAGQLEIARLLLFGGSLGLFSALPSIALAGLWLVFPGARRAAGPAGAFFIFLSVAYILAVLIVAPNDGGYSWSPRYLACVFAPLYLCIFAIFRRWRALHRWYVFAALAALAVYSLNFTHRGMKILQRTSKQNLAYSSAIQSFGLDVVVFDAPPTIGFMSEEILSDMRLYMALEKESAGDLLARLAATGVREFLYLRTPLRAPSIALETAIDGDQSSAVFRSVQQKDVGGMQIHHMRLTADSN
ncbi:MAG: hypothetical protein RIF32_16310 [Leptospirales bacterium]